MVKYRIVHPLDNGETMECEGWASRTEYNKIVEEIELFNYGDIYEAEAVTTLTGSANRKVAGILSPDENMIKKIGLY